MEMAVEAGLCPTNISQPVYTNKPITDGRKISMRFLWRAPCAQTFQVFDLYATLFHLFKILSQVSYFEFHL